MDEHKVQGSDALRETLRPLAESPVGDHPDIEELLQFQLGELSPNRNEIVTDHVALCIQCTEALVDLDAFPDIDLGPGAETVTEADVQELRHALEEQISDSFSDSGDAASAAVSAAGTTSQAPAPRRNPWDSILWLRAASIVLMVSSLTFGGLWWQSKGPATTTPVLTSETLTLRAVDGDVQRDGVAASRLSDAATDLVHVSFQVPATQPFDTFEAVFLDAEGQSVLETPPFTEHHRLITVAVRRNALPSGPIRILLYGLTDDGRTPLGTYALDRAEEEVP